MTDEEIQWEWDYETKSGQHTNGPRLCSLTATSIKTGIIVHIPNSKYQYRIRELARSLLELADAEYERRL